MQTTAAPPSPAPPAVPPASTPTTPPSAIAGLLAPTKLDWPTQAKYDEVRNMLGTALLGGGAGVGARLLHEFLYAPKPREVAVQRRPQQKRADAGATTSTVPAAAAELLQQLPSALPATPGASWWGRGVGLPLGIASGYGGWKATDVAFDSLRKWRLRRETDRAKRDYDKMVSDYYRQAIQKHAEDLTPVYAAVKEAQQPAATPSAALAKPSLPAAAPPQPGAVSSLLHGAGGIYLAALLGAGAVGHLGTYEALQKARRDAAQEVMRARAEQRRQIRDPLPTTLLDDITPTA